MSYFPGADEVLAIQNLIPLIPSTALTSNAVFSPVIDIKNTVALNLGVSNVSVPVSMAMQTLNLHFIVNSYTSGTVTPYVEAINTNAYPNITTLAQAQAAFNLVLIPASSPYLIDPSCLLAVDYALPTDPAFNNQRNDIGQSVVRGSAVQIQSLIATAISHSSAVGLPVAIKMGILPIGNFQFIRVSLVPTSAVANMQVIGVCESRGMV